MISRLVLGLGLLVLAAGTSSGQAPRRVALVGGTLIDGYGGRPIRNSVILVEGERITAVGTVGTLAVPRDAQVISTEGMSVLPGLWDMHVHTMLVGHADYGHWDSTYTNSTTGILGRVIMPASAKQLLMAGVTSARDLGGPLEASITVRDRINAGKRIGTIEAVSRLASRPFSPSRQPLPSRPCRAGDVGGVVVGGQDSTARPRPASRLGSGSEQMPPRLSSAVHGRLRHNNDA